MPSVTTHPAGTFCWIELSTSDADAAKSFYSSLFGWDHEDVPMGEQGMYTILRKDGRDAAALYQQNDPAVSPHWTSYVAVTSADATAERAKTLGGGVTGPFDVADLGRMAFISDPQGAVFAIWEAKAHHGIGIRDEASSLCWNELQADDSEASKAFYAPLFDWRVKESEGYVEWHAGTDAVGGMLQSEAPGEVPSHWLPYFAVTDCDATVGKATSLGATAVTEPADVPDVGRFSVLADPQGAVFAVIRLDAQ